MTNMKWGAAQIRLTTFQDGASKPGAWKLVTGEEPETSAANNRARTHEEGGPYEKLSLRHVATWGRDDWLVTPTLPDDATIVQAFATADGLRVLERVARSWLVTLEPRPTRIAFGAVLHDEPAKDRADGYKRLGAFIKDVRLDPASEDFHYQINWPRQSKVTDIKLNRLSKWAVSMRTWQPLAVVHANRISLGAPHSVVFQVQLELDISTDAHRSEPLGGNLAELWSELTSLGLEISLEGNIP